MALFTTLPSCGQDLGAALAAASPNEAQWVGYEAPMLSDDVTVCGNWSGGVTSRQAKILLDRPKTLRLLFHVDHDKVDQMLLASEDCEIDTGSQKMTMLPAVSAAASVRYLANREGDSGMYAISLHRDSIATETLIVLARSKDPKSEEFIGLVLR